MRDKNNGEPPDPGPFEQLSIQFVARDFVQGAEGFVHEEQIGLRDQRARDGDPHLHAAGNLPGIVLLKALQTHLIERPFSRRIRFTSRCPCKIEGQSHIGQYPRPRHQRGVLKNEYQAAS